MNWVTNNLDTILTLSVEHIRLSLVPIIVGFVVAIPVGVFAFRYRRTRGVVLTIVGILYTVPSLALIGLLPPILGTPVLSSANLVIALTIYAVALMTRSAADAFASVDADTRQAALALGYSSWGRFWAVDVPLAGPVLLAGLRVVSVSTVSLVTVGALVGTASLGSLFTDGLQRGIPGAIAAGIVATVAIALAFDGLLLLLGRLLMPWTRSAPAVRRRERAGAGA